MKENKGNVQDNQKKGLSDRLYPVLLVAFGCIFLTVTGEWGVYLKPLQNGSSRVLSVMKSYTGGQRPGTEGDLWHADSGSETGINDENPANAGGEGSPMGNPEGIGEENDGPADSSQAEVVFQTVEDDYFADAVFIGDSRVVGMYEYGGLEDISTFYASTGLSVYKLFTAQIVQVPGQRKKITVEDALLERQFSKVYLMIGINEMGTGTAESFLEKYAECVAHIRELQPDAVIYLQSIIKVTQERSDQGDYITNEGIDVRNEGIAALADGENIFYLDVNPPVCDETGAMIADYTYDGVHLKAQYIPLWKDFLKTHAVVKG